MSGQRYLITGASGQLGSYLLRELGAAGADVVAWSGRQTGTCLGHVLLPVHLTDTSSVTRAFRAAKPAIVIHAAAMASVAACHHEPELAAAVNTNATALLADLAREQNIRFIYISTDLVFDGEHGPYRETDSPVPLSCYGRTKLAAEQVVAEILPASARVRLSLMFGQSLIKRPCFFEDLLRALREGRPIGLFTDEWRTPLSLATAARAVVALAGSDFQGILHIGGPERLSRFDIGRRLAVYMGSPEQLLVQSLRNSTPGAEPRPRDVSLDSALWRSLFPSMSWPDIEQSFLELIGV